MQTSNRYERDNRQQVTGRPASQTWCLKGPDGLPAAPSAPSSPLLSQCLEPAFNTHSEETARQCIKVLKSKLARGPSC